MVKYFLFLRLISTKLQTPIIFSIFASSPLPLIEEYPIIPLNDIYFDDCYITKVKSVTVPANLNYDFYYRIDEEFHDLLLVAQDMSTKYVMVANPMEIADMLRYIVICYCAQV